MAGTPEIARENGKKGGRPKGSTSRPQLRNYYNERELAKLVADLKEKAKTDPTILKFVVEQIFGKAPQSLEVGNPDGSPLFSSLKELPDEQLEHIATTGTAGTSQEGTSPKTV